MTTEHTETATPARFVKHIRFHGLELALLNADGVDYIPAKPLCDLAELDWKSAKRTLQSPDKVYLFGIKRLIPPHIEGLGGLKPPRSRHKMAKTGGEPGDKASPIEGVLCLRLDCSRMYVAQISTERMRANGNHAGADRVRALQKEWAKVLHDYETHGIAVKGGPHNALRELAQTARAIEQLRDPRIRQMLAAALHDELTALGLPVDTLDDAQLPLPLPAAQGA